MSDSLQSRLSGIRSRVRRLLWVYGLSWLLTVLLGGVFVAGLLDWWLHLDDTGVRVVLGLAVLAGAAWAAWRHLVVPLGRPFSDVELALLVQRRFPELQDSLASTVEFLGQQDDPRIGSLALRQKVIDETRLRLEHVNIDDVVQPRSVLRVAAVAALICTPVVLVAALKPADATLAVNRLVFPLTAPAWPQKTMLRLLRDDFAPLGGDPSATLRLVRGDRLRLFVENTRGSLPDDAAIVYRFADDEVVSKPLRTSTLRDNTDRLREVGAAELVVTQGPVAFRAVGGDDSRMPWHTLEVVPPPMFEDLQVTVTPPAYLGRPAERLAEGVAHVRGLVGSQVEIAGRVNKPVDSARLQIGENSPLAVELSPSGRAIRAAFSIERAGVYPYRFLLRDREGFDNPEAPEYEIRGIADLVPDIYIDRPASDLQVTADAVVPLKIVARDDLGVTEVRMHYALGESDPAGSQSVVLYTSEPTEQLNIESPWQLSKLPLAQGMRVAFHAEAEDQYDLDSNHVGKSITRTLIIVTPAEKTSELVSRQSGLLEELERAFEMQRRAHDETGELELQLNKVGRLQPQDVDLLKRIELDQRQISSRLFNPTDGVEQRVGELFDELSYNNLDDPEMSERLQELLQELSQLREDHLPQIEQKLTLARKQAEIRSPDFGDDTSPDRDESVSPDSQREDNSQIRPPGPPAPTNERPTGSVAAPSPGGEGHSAPGLRGDTQQQALATARRHQQAVLESLGTMLEHLSQWRDHRELAEELADLIGVQERMIRDTAEIGEKTLTKSLSELTRQQQADLARLAERQQGHAARLEELRKRLGETAETMQQTNPSMAEALGEAKRQLAEQMTAGRMREAAEQLAENNIGQAAGNQQAALDDLTALKEILENRSATNTEAIISRLKQAEEELAAMLKKQEDLQRDVEHGAEIAEDEQRELELQRLMKQQQQLRDELANLSRRVERSRAAESSRTMKRAAARMGEAESNLGNDNPGGAHENQHEAIEDLEQARRELARSRREAQEQLAREMLRRIADDLSGMIARQQNVIDETQRLEQERRSRGNWSRAQLKSLSAVEDEQRRLKQQTDRLVEKLGAAEVFAAALRGASERMAVAAARLAERQTDETTLAREEAAKQRFVDLIAALDPQQQHAVPPTEPAPPGQGQPKGPQAERVPSLAQLKLLKTLQQDLIHRTEQLDALRGSAQPPADEQHAELEAIAREQGELADLARNLMRELGNATEPQQNIRDEER